MMMSGKAQLAAPGARLWEFGGAFVAQCPALLDAATHLKLERLPKPPQAVQGTPERYRAGAGLLLSAPSDFEASPLRRDVFRVGVYAYTLDGRAVVRPADGAAFVGGRDTPENRRRFRDAVGALAVLRVAIEEEPHTSWLRLASVRADGDAADIGPPGWWLAQGEQGRDGEAWEGGGCWRLTEWPATASVTDALLAYTPEAEHSVRLERGAWAGRSAGCTMRLRGKSSCLYRRFRP